MNDRIHDAKSFAIGGPAELVLAVHGHRRGALAFTPPAEMADRPILKAEVNHGRWIVRCPFCPGAEMADLNDPRFFCLSCYNVPIGGKWLPVQFPANRAALEAELLKRPASESRNWLPHESVADLRRENAEVFAVDLDEERG